MKILAHRGFWLKSDEKNTIPSFERALSSGYGIETDVRDCNGVLKISHDMPDVETLDFAAFLSLCHQHNNLTLALNIKSDGLQVPLRAMLAKYEITEYFLFDESVPNALVSYSKGLKIFTRQSEYEVHPTLYEESRGVWMDEFNRHWIVRSAIEQHLQNKKQVCIVSPELHGRCHLPVWEEYQDVAKASGSQLFLCTDYPDEARRFFDV